MVYIFIIRSTTPHFSGSYMIKPNETKKKSIFSGCRKMEESGKIKTLIYPLV